MSKPIGVAAPRHLARMTLTCKGCGASSRVGTDLVAQREFLAAHAPHASQPNPPQVDVEWPRRPRPDQQ